MNVHLPQCWWAEGELMIFSGRLDFLSVHVASTVSPARQSVGDSELEALGEGFMDLVCHNGTLEFVETLNALGLSGVGLVAAGEIEVCGTLSRSAGGSSPQRPAQRYSPSGAFVGPSIEVGNVPINDFALHHTSPSPPVAANQQLRTPPFTGRRWVAQLADALASAGTNIRTPRTVDLPNMIDCYPFLDAFGVGAGGQSLRHRRYAEDNSEQHQWPIQDHGNAANIPYLIDTPTYTREESTYPFTGSNISTPHNESLPPFFTKKFPVIFEKDLRADVGTENTDEGERRRFF